MFTTSYTRFWRIIKWILDKSLVVKYIPQLKKHPSLLQSLHSLWKFLWSAPSRLHYFATGENSTHGGQDQSQSDKFCLIIKPFTGLCCSLSHLKRFLDGNVFSILEFFLETQFGQCPKTTFNIHPPPNSNKKITFKINCIISLCSLSS